METNQTNRSLFERLFDRDYFKSLNNWLIDVLGCFVLAAAISPADPYSAYLVTVPLFAVWMLIRYAIIRRLRKPDTE